MATRALIGMRGAALQVGARGVCEIATTLLNRPIEPPLADAITEDEGQHLAALLLTFVNRGRGHSTKGS